MKDIRNFFGGAQQANSRPASGSPNRNGDRSQPQDHKLDGRNEVSESATSSARKRPNPVTDSSASANGMRAPASATEASPPPRKSSRLASPAVAKAQCAMSPAALAQASATEASPPPRKSSRLASPAVAKAQCAMSPAALVAASPSERPRPTEQSSTEKAALPATLNTGSVPLQDDDSTRLCLRGLRVVVTGVMESMPREDLEQLVMQRGGKVVGSVSGKTDYLVAGAVLDDGRAASESSKYRTALEKKVRIISERELLAMIPPASPQKDATSHSMPSSAAASGAKAQASGCSGSSSSNSRIGAGVGSGVVSSGSMLWVDKYKPSNSSQLIGSTELVRKLGEWLRRWDAVHLQKTAKVPFNKENPGAKAALLSGPPGIGKSTVAGLAARELGYDMIELNASDTRNKREIEGTLSSAVGSMAINTCGIGGLGQGVGSSKRRLIIMDEVDGMGGSDRGGIAELIKVIKLSKIPIICICNDRQSQKIRSLVNHCYDLRVKRPTKTQVAQRLVAIAQHEGLQVDPNAAEMLVEQAGNDIRQALNALQMWSYQSSTMHYAEARAGLGRIEKDKVLRLTPFDACGQILSGNRAPFSERYESFFIDYSLTPLLVQQNYVDAAKNGIFRAPGLDEAARLERLAMAADAVSDSDLASAAIRGQNQHWELLTTQAVFCVRAGAFVQGFQGFPSFPQWLGKFSSTNKMKRLTNELVHHTSLAIGQGFMPIRLDYAPYLQNRLLGLLQGGGVECGAGPDGVGQLVGMLDAYGLTKDDFTDNLREMQLTREGDSTLRDRFADLDSKIKAALTRAYNSASHKSQVLVSELGAKGGKRGKSRANGGAAGGEDALMGEEGEEASLLQDDGEGEAEEADDGEEDISALLAKPKKAAAKEAKGATSKAGTGKGSSAGRAKGGSRKK